MVEATYACCQDVNMAVAAFVHFLNVSDQIYAVFTTIIKSANKRGYINWLLDPRVAAYTAAACSWEKHSVMLTRIPSQTDISAALKPSVVHGYLT